VRALVCVLSRALAEVMMRARRSPPTGECRGFTGNCGDIAKQFANVPIMPLYPCGMADYKCTAWPDDDEPVDSFTVGLISLAVAIPVSAFMFSCFQSACAGGGKHAR
jgi:hypothetical protein